MASCIGLPALGISRATVVHPIFARMQQIKLFAKSQIASLAGGILDFALMVFFTEVIGFFYSLSILISGTIGGIINFTLNRRWAFKATDGSRRKQAPRFLICTIGTIVLKTIGTFLVTHGFKIDYKIGRLITDVVVAFGFNFTVQKYWVFAAEKQPASVS